MGYFKMPAPRRFNHTYIYVDERKEKLQKIEEKAKRDGSNLPVALSAHRPMDILKEFLSGNVGK